MMRNMIRLELCALTAFIDAKRRGSEFSRRFVENSDPVAHTHRYPPQSILLCFTKDLCVVNRTRPMTEAIDHEMETGLPEYAICLVYTILVVVSSTNKEAEERTHN